MNTLSTNTIKKTFFLLLLLTFFSSINFDDRTYYVTNSAYAFLLLLSILTYLNNDVKIVFFLILATLSVCGVLTTDISTTRYSDILAIIFYYLFLVAAIKSIVAYVSGYKSARKHPWTSQ